MQYTPKEATLLDSLMSNSIFEESTWSKGTESNKEIKMTVSFILYVLKSVWIAILIKMHKKDFWSYAVYEHNSWPYMNS